MNIKDKLTQWFRHHINPNTQLTLIGYRNIPRNFIRNVKRIKYWWKIIWNDRDYDHVFFLLIVRHKLNSILKDTDHWYRIDKDEKRQQIAQCIHDIDDILDADIDKFVEKEMKAFREQYGELITWSTKIKNSNMYEFHSTYSKCTTDAQTKLADEQALKIWKLQDERRQMVSDRLWDTIKNNYTSWWD